MPCQSSWYPLELSVPHRHQGLSFSHVAAGVALELCPAASCSSHDVLLLCCPKDSKNSFSCRKKEQLNVFSSFTSLGWGMEGIQSRRKGPDWELCWWEAFGQPWGAQRDSGVIICPHPGLGWLLLQEKQERFSTSILWSISISKSCLFSRFLIFLHNVYVVHGGVGLYLICWVCERSLSLLAWRGLDITSSLLLCLGARPQETGAAFIFQELPVVVIPPLNSHTCVARAKVGFLSQLFMSSPCR